MNLGARVYLGEGESEFMAGKAAFIRFDVYQNDVRTDSFDTSPGDYVVVLPAHYAPKAAGTRYDYGNDISGGDFHLHIADETQPSSIADTDNLFAMKLCDPHTHVASPFADL